MAAAYKKKLNALLHGVESACASKAWSSDDEVEVLAAVALLTSKTRQLPTRMKSEVDNANEKRERLWKWAKAAGAVCHPNVRLEACGEGTGIFVVGDVAANESIVVVPPRLAMRARQAGSRDELCGVLEASGMHPTVALALRLIYESRLGEESKFAAYVASLPRKYDTPLSWEASSLSRLGSCFRQACGSRRAAAIYYCELMKASRIRDCVGLIGWDEWIWAMSAVVTRQNSLPGGIGLCLVALWDSCNHAVDAPRTQFLQDGSLELRAAHPLSKGDQAFMFYGPRSDSELVLHSGFRLGRRNPYDIVNIQIDELPHSTVEKLVVTLLERAGVARTGQARRAWTGHLRRIDSVVVPDPTLRALSLAAAATDKVRLAHLMRTSDTDHAAWEPLDADHDEAARRFLLDHCDARAATIVANRAARCLSASKTPQSSHETHDNLASELFESETTMLLDAVTTLASSSLVAMKHTSRAGNQI